MAASREGESAANRQWLSLQKQVVMKMKDSSISHMRQSATETALEKGYLKVLDEDLIMQSQEAENTVPSDLDEVQRIQLNGCNVQALDEMAILSCVRLRICNLSGCYIQNISAFYGCINLLKLDLSDNQVAVIPPSNFWLSLTSLQILYLNGNMMSTKETLTRLNGCPSLHILTLYNTPLSLTKHYRHHVINSIFCLKALDQHVISDEEIIENLNLYGPYKALTNNFKLPLHITLKPGTSLKEEIRITYKVLLAVDRVLARYSPVTIIQRWFRGWMVRKTLLKSTNLQIRNLVTRNLSKLQHKKVKSLLQHLITISQSSSKQLHEDTPQTAASVLHDVSPPHLNNPPPPPSSPSPIMETHVVGVDSKTNKLQYSVHINMGRLQQGIEQTELKESKSSPLSAPGQRMLPRPAKRQDSWHASNPGQGSPAPEILETEKAWKQRKKESHIRTKANRLVAKKFQKNKQKDQKAIVKQEVLEVEIPGQENHEAQSEVEGKEAARDVSLEGQSVKSEVRESEDNSKKTAVALSGQALDILPHEELPPLASIKKSNREMMRTAQKEIHEHMLKMKLPLTKKSKDATRPDYMTKDNFIFTRAYATMKLSGVKKVEQVYHTRKQNKELMEKVVLVSRVRRERELRRNKRELLQTNLKDSVREWKAEEDAKLEQKRGALQEEKKRKIHKYVQKHSLDVLRTQKVQEDIQLSRDFGQNNILVNNTLCREDRRESLDASSAVCREKVQQARQDSIEQQEEVRKYMDLRRNKFLQEGRLSKEHLDARILEIGSQRLMEAKRKIAKESARKVTAQAAIALAKEELRACRHGPSEAMPDQSKGPIYQPEEDGQSLTSIVRRGFGMSSEYKSPSHISRMTQNSHKSWQRGAKVIKGNKCFPVLGKQEESPLMYQMMTPHHHYRHRQKKPITPFTEMNSSSYSLSSSKELPSNSHILIET